MGALLSRARGVARPAGGGDAPAPRARGFERLRRGDTAGALQVFQPRRRTTTGRGSAPRWRYLAVGDVDRARASVSRPPPRREARGRTARAAGRRGAGHRRCRRGPRASSTRRWRRTATRPAAARAAVVDRAARNQPDAARDIAERALAAHSALGRRARRRQRSRAEPVRSRRGARAISIARSPFDPGDVHALVNRARIRFGTDDTAGARAGRGPRPPPSPPTMHRCARCAGSSASPRATRPGARRLRGGGAARPRVRRATPRASASCTSARAGRRAAARGDADRDAARAEGGAVPELSGQGLLPGASAFPKGCRRSASAKRLDPRDPTPWLYASFFLRDQNQQVRRARRAATGDRAQRSSAPSIAAGCCSIAIWRPRTSASRRSTANWGSRPGAPSKRSTRSRPTSPTRARTSSWPKPTAACPIAPRRSAASCCSTSSTRRSIAIRSTTSPSTRRSSSSRASSLSATVETGSRDTRSATSASLRQRALRARGVSSRRRADDGLRPSANDDRVQGFFRASSRSGRAATCSSASAACAAARAPASRAPTAWFGLDTGDAGHPAAVHPAPDPNREQPLQRQRQSTLAPEAQWRRRLGAHGVGALRRPRHRSTSRAVRHLVAVRGLRPHAVRSALGRSAITNPFTIVRRPDSAGDAVRPPSGDRRHQSVWHDKDDSLFAKTISHRIGRRSTSRSGSDRDRYGDGDHTLRDEIQITPLAARHWRASPISRSELSRHRSRSAPSSWTKGTRGRSLGSAARRRPCVRAAAFRQLNTNFLGSNIAPPTVAGSSSRATSFPRPCATNTTSRSNTRATGRSSRCAGSIATTTSSVPDPGAAQLHPRGGRNGHRRQRLRQLDRHPRVTRVRRQSVRAARDGRFRPRRQPGARRRQRRFTRAASSSASRAAT